MPSNTDKQERLPEPSVLPRKAVRPNHHRMRDAAVGGGGYQAGGDYGGAYSEEGSRCVPETD